MGNAVRYWCVGVQVLVAFGATACGGGTQVEGGDRSPVVKGETGGARDDDPVTSNGGSNDSNSGGATGTGAATGTGGAAGTGGATGAACAKGFDGQNPGGRVCNSTYKGTCFESDAEACACAGCGSECTVAESYPSQVFCPTAPRCVGGFDAPASSDDECNFVANGVCFAEPEPACACAGCTAAKCMILESYPAQIRCGN
jgi:hypothetical protein